MSTNKRTELVDINIDIASRHTLQRLTKRICTTREETFASQYSTKSCLFTQQKRIDWRRELNLVDRAINLGVS